MLQFNVDKQFLELEVDKPIVADSLGYLSAEFTFSNDWNNYDKVLHLRNGNNYYSIDIENDEIDSIDLTAGIWEVWIHGYNSDATKRITTTSVRFEVTKFNGEDGDVYPEMEASVVDRLLKILIFNGQGTKYLSDRGQYDPLTVDEETVKEAVTDYLSENPIVDDTTVSTTKAYSSSKVSQIVGSKADTSAIPTLTSQLTNNSGYITSSALSGYARTSDIPTNVSSLTNDSGYINSVKTINNQSIVGSGNITIGGAVNSVNGKTGTVTLSASDVNALPSSTVIPSKLSDLTNDSGYLTLATLPKYEGSVE